MTDRERFSTETTPRSDALCRRYMFAYEGVTGFIVYGVLWAFPALPGAAILATVITPRLPLVGFLVASLLMWSPYLTWVYRRTAPARLFFRNAVLVEGTLSLVEPDVGRNGGMTRFEVTFQHEGRPLSASSSMFTGRDNSGILVVGSSAPVLYAPGDTRCGVFAYDGTMRMGDVSSLSIEPPTPNPPMFRCPDVPMSRCPDVPNPSWKLGARSAPRS